MGNNVILWMARCAGIRAVALVHITPLAQGDCRRSLSQMRHGLREAKCVSRELAALTAAAPLAAPLTPPPMGRQAGCDLLLRIACKSSLCWLDCDSFATGPPGAALLPSLCHGPAHRSRPSRSGRSPGARPCPHRQEEGLQGAQMLQLEGRQVPLWARLTPAPSPGAPGWESGPGRPPGRTP